MAQHRTSRGEKSTFESNGGRRTDNIYIPRRAKHQAPVKQSLISRLLGKKK